MKTPFIFKKTYSFLLGLLFPKFCLNCRRFGSYLCDDCLSLIDFPLAPAENIPGLSLLYFASDYNHFLIKRLLHKFKYQPFVKDLAIVFCLIIISYFANLEKQPGFLSSKENCLLVPIPLFPRRERWRGFNQSEEIAKELSRALALPLENLLSKNKETANQADLSETERKENVKGVFNLIGQEKAKKIEGKIVLLIDDVFTTGATMAEAAKTLRTAGAAKVIGIVVARD